MEFLNKNLEENTKKLNLLKSLPLYEFLLSIEKAYQENNELVSFSYEYIDKKRERCCELVKIKDDGEKKFIEWFNNSIKAFPTDKDGIESFSISPTGMYNISVWEYNS